LGDLLKGLQKHSEEVAKKQAKEAALKKKQAAKHRAAYFEKIPGEMEGVLQTWLGKITSDAHVAAQKSYTGTVSSTYGPWKTYEECCEEQGIRVAYLVKKLTTEGFTVKTEQRSFNGSNDPEWPTDPGLRTDIHFTW